MQIYRSETVVLKDGSILIKGLPFEAGDKVEVVIRPQQPKPKLNGRYPLRGTQIRYINPFESVAEEDWETLK
ncbi:MAG: hypothetical protein ONB13_11575 [candidate division KSB1 bacterium]|nr:hypothetical protein [candidate division KSB1 bacterium]MDZ7400919.1 hypothetical protein [candidate division KSB1 bacterium]